MEEAKLILSLSLPAILAQLTSIVMQYIDAGMVGSLGANATAAIGLVSSSIWLLSGFTIATAAGFSVQVAQLIGAEREEEAKDVLRQSLSFLLLVGLILMGIGQWISGPLPRLLGGAEDICQDASSYFFIFSCVLPFTQMRQLSSAMMQSSGDMKTPSALSVLVCVLDVIFNMFFIFPTREVTVLGIVITLPGMGLKVVGAALGTATAEVVVSLLMLYALCVRSKKLSLVGKGDWHWKKATMGRAFKVAAPLTVDHFFTRTAYIAGTLLVAPLGTISVAANSLAITAESLCYMPGYGIGAAATAIIGQTIGAEREDLTKSFSRLTVALGAGLMGLTAIIMYIAAPFTFSMLTSDASVAALGVTVLRLELFSEPLYGASICCAGVFRGAGDTLLPSVLNLVSMWGVRIVLAFLLIPSMGLRGFWLAMCIELCFRGIIFLVRLFRNNWMKKSLVAE